MNIPIVTDVFSMIMKLIMEVISNNFGIAIILFTVITKILLFPLQLKSKKGMIDQQRIAHVLQYLHFTKAFLYIFNLKNTHTPYLHVSCLTATFITQTTYPVSDS